MVPRAPAGKRYKRVYIFPKVWLHAPVGSSLSSPELHRNYMITGGLKVSTTGKQNGGMATNMPVLSAENRSRAPLRPPKCGFLAARRASGLIGEASGVRKASGFGARTVFQAGSAVSRASRRVDMVGRPNIPAGISELRRCYYSMIEARR